MVVEAKPSWEGVRHKVVCALGVASQQVACYTLVVEIFLGEVELVASQPVASRRGEVCKLGSVVDKLGLVA
jgi:hypothetical protein